ncbi:PAS domain S-box protein [Geoalkalibacter halelectricus]|uniref:histidine kinase n=1 Tax=Geoalkalibacter halelectricus TaxID=2847045 RepID=A0ABY5ZJH6_9BACT|nr:PAS domain S-box protein [Geoalkalibacter halelectricus]UWZ78095.1 PAS domain S-box protein [Geoalkalibacter halelectricus]
MNEPNIARCAADAEQQRSEFFECMDRINRVIHQSDDVEQMLWRVLESAFGMFGCDRIWLFYPCDPEAPTYRIPVEITRPEYPGAHALDVEVPMKPMGDRFCAKVLAADGPVVFGPATDPPIFPELSEQFGVRSQLSMALYPRVGKPWMLGMHQCSHARDWSDAEQRLFEGLGRRIAEGLSTLLLLRDLRQSQERLDLAVTGSREGLWDWPDLDQDAMWWSPRVYEMFGYRPDELKPAQSTLVALASPEDQARFWPTFQAFLNSDESVYDFQFRARSKAGEELWIGSRGRLVRDSKGRPLRMSGAFEDITQRRRVEDELESYRLQLERLVDERTAELQRANDQLKRANRELEHAGQELRHSEERLRLFIKHAPAALAMFDRDMCYLAASHRWKSDFGLGDRDLIGLWEYEVFPDLPDHWKEANDRALAGEVTKVDEDRYERPDGSVQWLRWEARPWHDAVGGIGGIVVACEDITAIKIAEQARRDSESQLQILFEKSPLSIVLVDPADMHFVRFNEKAHTSLGYSREEFARLRVFDLDNRYSAEEIRAILPKLQNSDWHQFESTARTAAGDTRDFQITGQVVEIGGKLLLLQILEDISERKAMERELRQAKDSAEEASRAKSDFLATMSHEIRTPLTVVMAGIEHLLHNAADPQQKAVLEMVDNSAERLHILIEDILDFSRIEARRLEIHREPFNVRDCLDKTLEMFRMQARDKGLELATEISPDVPDTFCGDADRLAQVLINLVGNAVKFTPAGRISVRVGRDARNLLIHVEDTGIGIAQDQLGRLFESFSQLDSSLTRKYGGTGLGLAISKSLAELMGGSLSVSSEQGKGSTFSLTLPLQAAPGEGESAPCTEAVSVVEPSPALILLVDDDPQVRKLVGLILGGGNWQVTTVSSGAEAVERVLEQRFDLVLMDLQMSGMDGLEATRIIREAEAKSGAHTPIVALTAHARVDYKEQCLAAGMDDFLSKPVSKQKLRGMLEKHLRDSVEDASSLSCGR